MRGLTVVSRLCDSDLVDKSEACIDELASVLCRGRGKQLSQVERLVDEAHLQRAHSDGRALELEGGDSAGRKGKDDEEGEHCKCVEVAN
jgi:hypothetical protein